MDGGGGKELNSVNGAYNSAIYDIQLLQSEKTRDLVVTIATNECIPELDIVIFRQPKNTLAVWYLSEGILLK